jgi:hypothetical protein
MPLAQDADVFEPAVSRELVFEHPDFVVGEEREGL